ncbi:hypothetical protein GOV05_00760 [Candidatus Woesearchaeota archaeon]|nr:hypothetical protein [Candidatus Woesearchaeota archaeon]
MPIDESLITREVLDNTLVKEIYPEIKTESEPRMGKVRSVYDVSPEELLLSSSDSLSSHDVVLLRQVFAKGENLDAISSHFFEQTKNIIPNHYIETLAPNMWRVQKAEPILVEMVFRQYITGSGWRSYESNKGPEQGSEFCGVQLRDGYRKNEKLDEIVFTPTAKGQVKDFDISEFAGLNPEEDDPKIDVDMIRNNYAAFGLRKPEDIDFLTEASFNLYRAIHTELESKGQLLADTKWEFGYLPDGRIALIDECVTPDSSRIWEDASYVFNPEENEFTIVQSDKQHFRDHVETMGLQTPDKKEELAAYWMPDKVLRDGVVKYANIRETITGTLPEITAIPKKEIIMDALSKVGYLK